MPLLSIRLLTTRSMISRHLSTLASSRIWSGTLSFASPESDFSQWNVASSSSTTNAAAAAMYSTQNATSPDTHALEGHSRWLGRPAKTAASTFSWSPKQEAQAMADLSSAWTATGSPLPLQQKQERDSVYLHLPRTLREALMEEHRALVVTTAASPHLIVHVNKAWEDLCGYKKQEVLHRSLAVIQGPDSNREVANGMVRILETQHQEQEIYLVNYKKNGQAFVNHVTAGPLYQDESQISEEKEPEFMVGILEEVSRDVVPLRMMPLV